MSEKCLNSTLQMTILDVLGYFLEIFCSHLIPPRFQPEDEPSHLTLLISSLVLGHPSGKLEECASSEEYLPFLAAALQKLSWMLIVGLWLSKRTRMGQ